MKTDKDIKMLKDRYGIGKVLDVYDTGRFKDIVCKKGSDVVTFRVYSNGTVTER